MNEIQGLQVDGMVARDGNGDNYFVTSLTNGENSTSYAIPVDLDSLPLEEPGKVSVPTIAYSIRGSQGHEVKDKPTLARIACAMHKDNESFDL